MRAQIICSIFLITGISVRGQVADSSRREVKLEGAANFRDIGGYPSREGKHVKWNRLYRSGELSHLTPPDLSKLRNLSIEYVADFRGPLEVKAAPDRMPANATRIWLPAGSENTGDSIYMRQMLSMAKDSGLVPFYSDIHSLGERYKPLFEAMLNLNADSALLFHCTAGKDRTGIAAALILYALNVEENKIMEDYLASNYYRRADNERSIKGMMLMYHMDEQTARNLMGVQQDYLLATFRSIKAQYGNIDNYLDQVMGMPAAKRKLLREKFLE